MNLENNKKISKEHIQNLEDFEILKKIIKREIEIKDVDYDIKIRLINLCNKRAKEIDKKIKKLKKEN